MTSWLRTISDLHPNNENCVRDFLPLFFYFSPPLIFTPYFCFVQSSHLTDILHSVIPNLRLLNSYDAVLFFF